MTTLPALSSPTCTTTSVSTAPSFSSNMSNVPPAPDDDMIDVKASSANPPTLRTPTTPQPPNPSEHPTPSDNSTNPTNLTNPPQPNNPASNPTNPAPPFDLAAPHHHPHVHSLSASSVNPSATATQHQHPHQQPSLQSLVADPSHHHHPQPPSTSLENRYDLFPDISVPSTTSQDPSNQCQSAAAAVAAAAAASASYGSQPQPQPQPHSMYPSPRATLDIYSSAIPLPAQSRRIMKRVPTSSSVVGTAASTSANQSSVAAALATAASVNMMQSPQPNPSSSLTMGVGLLNLSNVNLASTANTATTPTTTDAQQQQQQTPNTNTTATTTTSIPTPPILAPNTAVTAAATGNTRSSSPSPSIPSPIHHSQQQQQHRGGSTVSAAQSSLERRKAHRAYTQKSRNKVNSRFEALLSALPTPPPRLNPRSKAEILEYATDTVLRLVARNNKLELSLALSSTPQLDAWLTEQTQHARTIHEVCSPIVKLFTIGLDWKGAEVWAVDSRAPMNHGALGQAWTFIPPVPSSGGVGVGSVGVGVAGPSGGDVSSIGGIRPGFVPPGGAPSSSASPFFRDPNVQHQQQRQSELSTFLESGKGTYFETSSNEALAVVYRSGKAAWLSCEYKSYLGFENAEFTTERTRLAATYGISDVLFVPLILYNNVQVVVCFYNMRSRSASGNPALQPQMDPESAIRVATEAIDIIARKFCSIPGVSEFGENN